MINTFKTIDDLPLSKEDKAKVLMWFAHKVADIFGIENSKEYDPMVIDNSNLDGKIVALSYIFDFRDGGRQHTFDDLKAVETGLIREAQREINEANI